METDSPLIDKIRDSFNNLEFYKRLAIFIFLFAGPLITFKKAYDYTIIKELAGYIFCLVFASVFALQKSSFTFEKRSFYIFLFFAAWTLLSGLAAPFKYGAAESLQHFILYFMIFAIALQLRLTKTDTYFWIGSGLIASIVAFFHFFGPRGYPISTFGNPNFFAGHIMIVITLGFAILLSKVKTNEKLLAALFISIAIGAVMLTKSRAAIFAVGFGMATTFFLFRSGRKNYSISRWTGYILLLIAGIYLFPTVQDWIANNIRIYIWRGTWSMIRARPIAGWGLGNFVFFYPYFRVRNYFMQAEATPVTTQPHNEYLHTWVETGIIGLAAFLVLIFFIITAFRRTQWKDENDRILLCGATAAIGAVLIDNIFSTNLRNPSTAMYFWFLLGILANYSKTKKVFFNISRFLWYTIIGVCLTMILFVAAYRILPGIYMKNAIWDNDAGNYHSALGNYAVTLGIYPYNYEAWYKMAYAYGSVGDFEKAGEIYRLIDERLFPLYAKTNANLGTVYMNQGKPGRALKEYKRAEWLNPYDIDVLCGIASIYLVHYDNKAEAMVYLERVLRIDPSNAYANRIKELLQ